MPASRQTDKTLKEHGSGIAGGRLVWEDGKRKKKKRQGSARAGSRPACTGIPHHVCWLPRASALGASALGVACIIGLEKSTWVIRAEGGMASSAGRSSL